MAGTSRLCENAALGRRRRMNFFVGQDRCLPVMAGLVPVIHGLRSFNNLKSWMIGTRPVKTETQRPCGATWNFLLYIEGGAQFPHSLTRPAMTGRGLAKWTCQQFLREDGTTKSYETRELASEKKARTEQLTAGNSIVKWEKRTCFVHSHCSWGVGTLLGCSFHLRKYGMASIIIQGMQRPK